MQLVTNGRRRKLVSTRLAAETHGQLHCRSYSRSRSRTPRWGIIDGSSHSSCGGVSPYPSWLCGCLSVPIDALYISRLLTLSVMSLCRRRSDSRSRSPASRYANLWLFFPYVCVHCLPHWRTSSATMRPDRDHADTQEGQHATPSHCFTLQVCQVQLLHHNLTIQAVTASSCLVLRAHPLSNCRSRSPVSRSRSPASRSRSRSGSPAAAKSKSRSASPAARSVSPAAKSASRSRSRSRS